MYTLKYVWRNVRRNSVRSLLTVLSVGFSLALMTVLYGFLASTDTYRQEASQSNRIVVMNIQGFAGSLPISAVDDVRRTKSVAAAVPLAWYGGAYQDERMPFATFATDPAAFFDVWPDYTIPRNSSKPGRAIGRAASSTAESQNDAVGVLAPASHSKAPSTRSRSISKSAESSIPPKTPIPSTSTGITSTKDSARSASRNSITPAQSSRVEAKDDMTGVIKAVDDRFGSSDTHTQPDRSRLRQNVRRYARQRAGAHSQHRTRRRLLSVTGHRQRHGHGHARTRHRNCSAQSHRLFSCQSPLPRARRSLSNFHARRCRRGRCGLRVSAGHEPGHPQFFPLALNELAGLWMTYGLIAAAFAEIVSGIVPALQAARLSVINGLRRIA
ncbi:MAG UNVERIFIED_CONTAM: ABC transporter permease [Planctomycetaceae bacterium]